MTSSTNGNPKAQAQKSSCVTKTDTHHPSLIIVIVTTLQLVDKRTNEIAAQSHSRIRNGFFKKPRDLSLEISGPISHAVDIVLLTFILVWRERQTERNKDLGESYPDMINLLPFPGGLCKCSAVQLLYI
jgi:hypothetical protein